MRLAETPIPAASAALIAGWPHLPAPRHKDDLRQKTRRHWLRGLLATGAPEGHTLVERALAGEPELVPLEELPSPLAGTVVAIYLRQKDKRLREAARQWIGSRCQAPEVARALEAVGLAPEDFPRRSR
jgi:hypothetical protein